MQFSSALIAAVAIGFANAAAFTNSAFNGITAGQSIDLTWTNATGPVTINLKNGPSGNLQTVSTVASGQTGGSFTWAVPSTLPKDTYALEITDSTGVPNYSPQFELIGGAASSSSASASASASSSSAVSSISSAASSASSSLSSVVSSVSSSLSSVIESITANSTTSTAAPSTTGASNGTVTTGSPSSTRASTTGGSRTTSAGSSTSTASVPNSNSASDIASPLALVFLTFAAILSLN